MSYYYSTDGKDTSVDNIKVQIVKGELRAVGDTYGGWYWINKTNELDYDLSSELVTILSGDIPGLQKILLKIYKLDKDFLELILKKMYSSYQRSKFSLGMFEYDIDRRKELDDHIPEKEKFAIFQANDNGVATGFAVAVGEVLTTGDWMEDRRSAVIDGLVQGLGWPKEKAEEAGWFTAQPYKEYYEEVQKRFEDTKQEIEILEAAK